MKQPQAKKIPHTISMHGQTRVDNYHWLRDDNWQEFIEGKLNFSNPDVKTYIDDENSYTDHHMKETEQLQEELYQELVSRINEDDSEAPMKYGEYYYYSRIEKGKDYRYMCRKKGSLSAKEEIYFDQNTAAKGLGYYRLGSKTISKDNCYMAYCENVTGSMKYQLKVRDLSTGKDFDWTIDECQGSLEWCNDYKHLYYTERHEVNGRGHRVYRFNIFEGPQSRTLIFEKPEEYADLFMGLDKTSDDRFLLIGLEDSNANAVYYADASDPAAHFKIFHTLKKDNLVEVDHAHDHFYILTDEDGNINNKLMITPTDKIDHQHWTELVPHQENQHLTSFDLFNNHLVLCYTDNSMALPKIGVSNLQAKEIHFISMPDAAYDIEYYGAAEFESDTFQYSYESPIRPRETHAYTLNSGKVEIVKEGKCPNFDNSKYFVERVFAPAHDGELIPLTIITPKDFKRDGTAKGYQYAYGSYGFSMPAYFSASRFSLIDRGFIYAIAHIRGGSDKGQKWYLDGKLNKKMNTFKDFISCSEYLIKEGYCANDKLVANGGSAGGLLMGAISNMRPDLYASVILDVPFVDVISTICDDTLPLTPPEWNEWGNPITDPKAFNYMMSYSPYDNVEAKDYPNMLFNSGITDEQVTYWEPTKMVAKLRELKTDSNLLLLKMKMTAGHAGSSARYQAMREQAFDFAFVLKTVTK